MKLLADENIHGDLVKWLRSRGHDVLYAAEAFPSISDDGLLAVARNEDRVLITDDKDFGELVFHRRLVTRGVILIRLSARSASERIERLSRIWSDVESQVSYKFIVISDRKVRVRGVLRQP